MFRLKIETDNAAFTDEDGEPTDELPALVDHVVRRLRIGGQEPRKGRVLDSNGNSVGEWEIT